MRDLLPCLLKLLNLNKQGGKEEGSAHGKMKLASQGANWKKLKAPIKSYLDDVLTVNTKIILKITHR
jgi:hypothetical protein